jgi:hypothetical protein
MKAERLCSMASTSSANMPMLVSNLETEGEDVDCEL